MAEERLQKILSKSGYGARRKCESIILEKRVTVNNQIICELGAKADPDIDDIKVDGKNVSFEKIYYVMFNKPAGCLTTAAPDIHRGRSTVMDFFKDFPARIFPVGRLDYDTEGLLLLTNDGEFANRILHPKHKVFKTYEALIQSLPSNSQIEQLNNGILLDDGITAPAKIKTISGNKFIEYSKGKFRGALMEISIREGRKRQVRRMFRAIGYEVLYLKRVKIGKLKLGSLPVGTYKILTDKEAESATVELTDSSY